MVRLPLLATPPVDMHLEVAPDHATIMIMACLSVGALVSAAIHWKRTGRPIMLLLILGGGCMMAMESMVDTVAACWFAVDSKIAFVGWGRPIALWVCLTYFAYFGLGGGVIWIAMQRGARALAGARLLLSIPAVLCTSAAANAAAGWPSWFVINGDLGPLWTQIGGLASIGIACAIVQVLATLVARPSAALPSAGRSWLATASGR